MTQPTRTEAGTGLDRPLTPFVDPLPLPPRYQVIEPTRLTVHVEAAQHRFHAELPPSPVWTYDGQLPGPMIDVRRGVPVEMRWDNRLRGHLAGDGGARPGLRRRRAPAGAMPPRAQRR